MFDSEVFFQMSTTYSTCHKKINNFIFIYTQLDFFNCYIIWELSIQEARVLNFDKSFRACSPQLIFSSVQFSSVQFSSVQISSVQFRPVQFSSVQLLTILLLSHITIHFSSVQFSSVQISSDQFRSVQFSSVQFSSVQFSYFMPKRTGPQLRY